MPKLCEDCEGKHASFGTQAEGTRRWCGSCGKARGAINLNVHEMCEDCEGKQASFGMMAEGTRRWCGS
jgi:hypothetical protein